MSSRNGIRVIRTLHKTILCNVRKILYVEHPLEHYKGRKQPYIHIYLDHAGEQSPIILWFDNVEDAEKEFKEIQMDLESLLF